MQAEFDIVVAAANVVAALVGLAGMYGGYKVIKVVWLGGKKYKVTLKDK